MFTTIQLGWFLLGALAIQLLSGKLLSLILLLAIITFQLGLPRYRWHQPIILIVLGLGWVYLHAANIYRYTLPQQARYRSLPIAGYVASIPTKNNLRVKFDFVVTAVYDQSIHWLLPVKIQLTDYSQLKTYRAGQAWQLSAKLRPIRGFHNDAGPDYEKIQFAKRITATGTIDKHADTFELDTCQFPHLILCLQQRIHDQLLTLIKNHRLAGVILALTIGDRSVLSASDWSSFQKTGTSHLFAISGLHVALFYLLVYRVAFFVLSFCYQLCLRWPAQQYARVAGLAMAFAYSVLSGLSISTQRALLMLMISQCSYFFYQPSQPLRCLLLSFFMLILADASAPLQAGFWLSFCAVFFIFYLLNCGHAYANTIREKVAMQIKIVMAMMPLSLFYFNSFSLLALPANLVVIPIMATVVIPVALCSVILLSINPSVSQFCLLSLEPIVNFIFYYLKTLQQHPLISFHASFGHMELWLLSIASLLWLTPIKFPLKATALIYGLFCFLPLRGCQQQALRLTVLDVGQGLAVVIRTAQHSLVYDTGARLSPNFDIGQLVVVPYLRRQHITRLDKLVISHADNDHRGGMSAVLAAVPVQLIDSSVPSIYQRPQGQACVAGLAWRWDGVQFDYLAPSKQSVYQGNNSSCVLRIRSANATVLLTGDIEAKTEEWLLAKGLRLRADVLLVPHHGSLTSSSFAFISAVKPRYAIISAGYHNQYRLPHPAVLRRYQQNDVQLINTANTGQVDVVFAQRGMLLRRWQDRAHRYWHSFS